MTQAQKMCVWRSPLAYLGLGLWLCAPQTIALADEISSLRNTTTVRAIQAAEPAVVNIEGNKPANPASSDSQQVNGMGAGVIIDSRGYILTNQHVVQDVGRIEVTLHDGTRYIGRLIARDPETDLAMVKITERSGAAFPVIKFGTSSDLLRGERVIAIGNPFGYHHTVTEGIISALHRDIPVNGSQDYPDLIQTDASINPGNSGGPLLNADGNMIGINAAVRIGAQGIGFAIPVDKATEIAAEMISQHRRGENPISVATKYDNGSSRVEVLRPGQTELRRGDVITAIASRPIRTRLDYEFALLDQTVSDLNIEVERAGNRVTSKIALDARGTAAPAAASSPSPRAQLASTATVQEQAYRALGLRLEVADAGTVRTIDSNYKGGLRVTSVRRDSPAFAAQIQVGDVLVGLHEWQTPNWDDLAWILKSKEYKATTSPKFHIMRGSSLYWSTLDTSLGLR